VEHLGAAGKNPIFREEIVCELLYYRYDSLGMLSHVMSNVYSHILYLLTANQFFIGNTFMLIQGIVFMLCGRSNDHPFHLGMQAGAIIEYSDMSVVIIYKFYAYFMDSGAFSGLYLIIMKVIKRARNLSEH